jgi:hypothetical protein
VVGLNPSFSNFATLWNSSSLEVKEATRKISGKELNQRMISLRY